MALDVMALLNTKFAAGLGGALGPALGGSPAGPSNAVSGAYGNGLDASAWNVNFSGVQSASSNQDKSGGVPGLGISGVSGVPGWMWLAGAAVVGVILWRRKSKQ